MNEFLNIISTKNYSLHNTDCGFFHAYAGLLNDWNGPSFKISHHSIFLDLKASCLHISVMRPKNHDTKFEADIWLWFAMLHFDLSNLIWFFNAQFLWNPNLCIWWHRSIPLNLLQLDSIELSSELNKKSSLHSERWPNELLSYFFLPRSHTMDDIESRIQLNVMSKKIIPILFHYLPSSNSEQIGRWIIKL